MKRSYEATYQTSPAMSDFEEIECKFLEVDPKELEKKLKKLGATREFKRLFKRYVFDFPDLRLNDQSSWLRVRDEGDKVTMAFKQRLGVVEGQSDQGMHEVEVEVSSFEHTAKLLRAIGMKPKFYEENWRTQYRLGDVEFMIDEWPLIPPYVEIEADSWGKVDAAAQKLGFDLADKLVCSTAQVYKHYGIRENDYSVLTFDKQEKT